jgi:hypothetical protein
MQKNNVITIQKELSPIVTRALGTTINRESDMPEAVELLSKLNQFNDKITEEKERITKPLMEALKVERSRWSPVEKQNTIGIDHLRSQMSLYRTAEMNKQKTEEAKIAQKLTDGTINIDKAMKAIEKIKVSEKEVATDAGLVQFRESQVLKITDELAIPREYLVVNEKEVLTALKAGKVVTGAMIEIVVCPVNYR